MPAEFPCPHCGRTLRAREDQSGKKVRCPACREVVTVPEPDIDEEYDLAAPEESVGKPGPEIPEALPAGGGEDTFTVATGEEATGRDRPRRRRRRRRRRRDEGNVVLETFHYYTASFGVFPWVMAGLLLMSCCMGGVGLLAPGLPIIVVVFGAVLYNVGWFWLVITAFRDDTFHGMLCLVTHFYALAYIFINLEEAWRPATVMILGIFVALFGAVLMGVSVAIHNPEGAAAFLI
jgi:phage FluMu protein Com